MIHYELIASGSSGNAAVIDSEILIDAGVPLKALRPYLKTLRVVLLTHEHKDHFNLSTIAALSRERPSLRFVCGHWLYQGLLDCGVIKFNIDKMDIYEKATYRNGLSVSMVPAIHNVPNCGYKVCLPSGEKLIYITDTNSLDGIEAKCFDLYMIEANYEDEEIRQRIKAKKAAGEYVYEYEVLKNHLSKAKADDFINRNIGPDGKFVYLHVHTTQEAGGLT